MDDSRRVEQEQTAPPRVPDEHGEEDPAVRPLQPDESAYVFVGVRGKRRRTGALDTLDIPDVRPHDFRRTAASMMASVGIQRLVIAKVLNHVDRGVTAIYDRHGYDAEKRVALEMWDRTMTAILAGKPAGTVVPFTRGDEPSEYAAPRKLSASRAAMQR